MANTNEYIVFEADQVLTNDHLNEMFGYLDQQDRWTRNKLIGIGIVCGFNLVHHTGVIEITKGCGVTSQGYLILKGAGQYAYIMPYAPADQPTDLPFIYTGNLPFYKPFCQGKTIYLLLTDDEYNNLEDSKKPQAQTLSSQKNGFLNDYVVVLFLEATETDLKNCSAFDCTNKGEKMQFNVRPLLVAKNDLPGAATTILTGAEKERLRFSELEIEKERARLKHEITFKRYNVPYTALQSSSDVIKAFAKIVDDNTLQEVANAYIYCYEKYASLLGQTSNPFLNLFKLLKERRDAVLANDPIFIQYFYDFVDDLILAYFEFCTKITGIVSQCCPDENLFPLHLILGDASVDTAAFTHDAWRTYFIYSPLFAKTSSEANETQFLFRRMLIMVKTFTILSGAAGRKTSTIKITPSQYGYAWLSQRAIPYYYHITTGADAIYNYWNYYKSSHGNAVFNLSYNANLYNHAKAATEPLLYDIEHYNFFRIEGHIGENHSTVLNNILKQRLEFNLPFDVVAISADMLRSNAKLPVCNMQDLETDYKLIISEFACKVHTPFCFLTKFPYPPDTGTFTGGLSGNAAIGNFEKFSVFRAKALIHFSNLSGAMQTSAYKLGDFMRKYCLPDDNNTIGGYYLQSLDSFRIFTSEVNSIHRTAEQNALFLVYDYIFAFVDAVEQLMFVLMTSTVANLDMASLQGRYDAYTKSLSRLMLILAELIASESLKLGAFVKELELDLLIDEFFILSTVCIDERLQTLIDEYNRRLYLFQLQNTFLNYYKKHPGLEHKAGVPKGGTFVLVYYSGNSYTTTQPANETTVGNIAVERAAAAQKERIVYKNLSSADERMIKTFVENCQGASDTDKTKIIDIFNPGPVNQRFSFKEGEVIADFYVPYLCCSDCPPIAYILPEEKPPVTKPTIDMATTFCDSDFKPETITVSPTGGKVTDESGNDVAGVDNTAFTFVPLTAGAGTYNLIYTQNGVASDPIKVTVIATPKESSFTFKSVFADQGAFTVTFIPDIPDNKFTYAWTFGAGFTPATSTDREPVITANVDASGGEVFTSASLQISNGTCPAPSASLDLTISGNGVFETSTIATEIDRAKEIANTIKTEAISTAGTTANVNEQASKDTQEPKTEIM